MFLRKTWRFVNFIIPICISPSCCKWIIVWFTPLTVGWSFYSPRASTSGSLPIQHILHQVFCKDKPTTLIKRTSVHKVCKSVGIHHLRHIYRSRYTEAIVIVYRSLSFFARFGSHQNYAEGGTGTIDGWCGSIFQYRNIFYVLRVDCI